ncbi:MAG: hypothetical protein HC915_08930, partial [Anaerolineae bacterium]|nr:hypothetical protein [Anaerolineae bacterium]
GVDQRVDLAVQGPRSLEVLLALEASEADRARLRGLGWSAATRLTLAGLEVVVSRTGYTGERVAYEVFVHPDQAAALFALLVDHGAQPCGLAARDSLRIEAGLPLYGHELAGPEAMGPGAAALEVTSKRTSPSLWGKRPIRRAKLRAMGSWCAFGWMIRACAPRFRATQCWTGGARGGPRDLVRGGPRRLPVGVGAGARELCQGGNAAVGLCSGCPRRGRSRTAERHLGDRLSAPQSVTVQSRFPKRGKK